MNDEHALAHHLEGVEGWLHVDEAQALYDSARVLPQRDSSLTLVEIGSWKGRSTIALASALKATGRPGRVVAIDPHTGSIEHHEAMGRVDTFADFMANLERVGVVDLVDTRRMTSHEAAGDFALGSVDLLFIDGSHEYDDVTRDIVDWVPRLRPPAPVVFNDTSWPGVYRALRERVTPRGTGFGNPRLVRSTLYLVYDPAAAPTTADRLQWTKVRTLLALRRVSHRLVPHLPRWAKQAANAVTARVAGAGSPP